MNRKEELAFLIRELQKEMPEYASYAVPEDEEQAFSLFRALCNVRTPGEHQPSERFLAAEADLLQSVTEEKGVTDVEDIPSSDADSRLAVWQGDITTLRADAIVNACNSQLLGCFRPLHSCIDNMIHTMAGVELREACFEIMRRQGREEPAGRAKSTPGFNLPARYVLQLSVRLSAGRSLGTTGSFSPPAIHLVWIWLLPAARIMSCSAAFPQGCSVFLRIRRQKLQ